MAGLHDVWTRMAGRVGQRAWMTLFGAIAGALIAALVLGIGTLADPPTPVSLQQIAAALRQTATTPYDDPGLIATPSVRPPTEEGGRWLPAAAGQAELARILGAAPDRVRLLVVAPVRFASRVPMPTGNRPAPMLAMMIPLEQATEPAQKPAGDPGTAVPLPTITPPPVTIAPVAPKPPPPANKAVPATTAPPVRKPQAEPVATPKPRPTTETGPSAPRHPAGEPVRDRSRDAPVKDGARADARVALRPLPASPPPQTIAPQAPAVSTVPPAEGAAPPSIVGPVPQPSIVLRPAPPANAAVKAIHGVRPRGIEGDFRAALRLETGGWLVVRPGKVGPRLAPELLAGLLLVLAAVIGGLFGGLAGWLFQRPLRAFAGMIDGSGRDPTRPLGALARSRDFATISTAFERLRLRLQGLVADRAALAGALSHDLRGPLDRIHQALEEAPRRTRDALHDEVIDVEEVVGSMQVFLRDAAAPGEVGRIELAALLALAVRAAKANGEEVLAAPRDDVWVDVDPAAIARALEQLIAYARRQKGPVLLQDMSDADHAVVEVIERVPARTVAATPFSPGLRPAAERSPPRGPARPNLAIARSIARAHGGEVRLVRAEAGVVAQLRLPRQPAA